MDNLERSSMYSGVVEGVGPRYCPSIEDKFVGFFYFSSDELFFFGLIFILGSQVVYHAMFKSK